jgi:hypothetical protein
MNDSINAQVNTAYNLRRDGKIEEAVRQIEAVLLRTDLPEIEAPFLHGVKNRWQNLLDCDYQSLSGVNFDDFETFKEVYNESARKQDYERCIALSWSYLQKCSFGTMHFQKSLCLLVNASVLHGMMPLAVYAAEMYVSHYLAICSAVDMAATPVYKGDVNEIKANSISRLVMGFYHPVRAARLVIQQRDERCWAEIIELAIDENRRLTEKPLLANSLVNYYKRVFDQSNVDRIEYKYRDLLSEI